MRFSTAAAPHIGSSSSVSWVMLQVLFALAPGILAMLWYFGWGVLINIGLAVLFAVAAEASMLALRRRPIRPFLLDFSAVLTAVLLALSLPPLATWWLTAIGALFALIIAKHLYGGLGHNPFNPAMAGYAVLLISFPKQMTLWLSPEGFGSFPLSFADTANLMLLQKIPAGLDFDAITRATPLDAVKTQLSLDKSLQEIRSLSAFGRVGGQGWEWIAVGYLLGGLWLTYRRVIAWQIPTGFLGGLAAMALIFFLIDADRFPSPLFHLFSGAAMLGAFFIATDPVTAAATPRGRLLYGFLIGILVFVIRSFGGYPDGVAFAVLLLNFAAPTIDHYTRPRVFGR